MNQSLESGLDQANSLAELVRSMGQDVERVEAHFAPHVSLQREQDGKLTVWIDWTDSYRGATSHHQDGSISEDEGTIETNNGPYQIGAEIMDRLMLGDELSFANRNRTVLYETGEDGARRGSTARGGGK